ncbi:MAG: ABC transporter substrate-binding protein [Chitinivibrionales bacterium]
MHFLSTVCLSILFTTSILFAQDDPRNVLNNARDHYRKGEYDSTISIIRRYLKDHGKEESTEYLVPLLMEALVRTGDQTYFDRLFKVYKDRFPNSAYMGRLFYLRGIQLARSQLHEEAVLSFSDACRKGIPSSLNKLVVENVDLICREVLTIDDLSRLTVKDLHHKVAEIVAYREFSRLYAENQAFRAKRKAEEFLQKFRRSRYEDEAKRIVNRTGSTADRNQVAVGLMAPISGYDADLGKLVVRGVQLAIEQFNQRGGLQIKPVISDTRGNMIETARKTRELVKAFDVPAIIGPILSSNAVVTASMVMDKDVVMITPTATDEGIASLGPTLFQLNVTLGMLGRKIAQYAMENINLKEFAVISPHSEYGRVLSAAFIEEVKKRGGEIISEEFFEEGTTDFRMQFESIRSALLARRREQMAVDQGISVDQVHETAYEDSVKYLDSTLSVGGIFIPAESEDVVMIAPQVAFNRIRTQLLGSNGWHSSKTILDGKRYVNDALISTSSEINMNDPKWKEFVRVYKARYGAEPDKVVAPLSYDATNLLLEALSKTGDLENGKEIARRLLAIQNYIGISGAISFHGTDGANKETAIMKINNKQFKRVQ